jgi:hypothetical protein
MKSRWLGMVLLLCGLAGPWSLVSSAQAADAIEITGREAEAIRTAVQAQLDAFAADDAAKAFALSTASTRNVLGSADNFLLMIKQEYPPVYRHRRAIFLAPQMLNGNTLQVVRLTDQDNNVWVAIYRMKVEQDGKWRIDGCSLLETTTVSI